MSDPVSGQISPGDLAALTKAARIELSEGRAETIAPALDGILQLFDALDAVDVGETPPTNAFDARWRDR